MSSPVSIKTAAARIADRFSAKEEGVARLLRTLVQEGVVTPSLRGGVEANSPALFDEAAICRAAILVHLDRLGQPPEVLRRVALCLNNERGEGDEKIGPSDPNAPDRLPAILDEMRSPQGKAWFLHVFLSPEFFGVPANVLGARFSTLSDGEAQDDFATTITLPLLTILPFETRGS